MTDEELKSLAKRLRLDWHPDDYERSAADAIESLMSERDALRADLALKEAVGNELNHSVANNRALNEYIDELRAQLDEAGKALEPLAVALTRAEKVYGATAEDGWSVAKTTVAKMVTYGDLRRARAVYEKIKGGRDE